MDAAQTLSELIDAARRAQVTALHICREPDGDAVYARFPAGLTRIRQAGPGAKWYEQAANVTGATAMAGRIAIAIERESATASALGGLGMPGRMWRAIDALDTPHGGVFVVVSRDPASRQAVMVALGQPAEHRYVPWIDPVRERVETAARMDCDAILIDGVTDRGTAALLFDIAHSGRRVVLGVEAADSIGAIAQLRSLRVERHMLGAALRAVVAVCPAPGLCAVCRLADQTSTSESALLGVDPGTAIYRAAGCGGCDGTGFGAPVMVFESIVADAPLRRLLVEGADATIIARHAFLKAPSLAGSARLLVREGVIPPDAAIRIAREGGVSPDARRRHPHVLSSSVEWVDDPASPPLSARLRGDRSSIG
ncbi:ATPase, T2SS/T4P/T4SS family [Sphingomonas sp. LT1P40]|uniref:ATPase, T2SS/T4P/T4SS family n=1 Tax=Alteristakelama amylovorans TaxID=3096166 RepID=UPI002FC5A996